MDARASGEGRWNWFCRRLSGRGKEARKDVTGAGT